MLPTAEKKTITSQEKEIKTIPHIPDRAWERVQAGTHFIVESNVGNGAIIPKVDNVELEILGNVGNKAGIHITNGNISINGNVGSEASLSVEKGTLSISGTLGREASIKITDGMLILNHKPPAEFAISYQIQRGTVFIAGEDKTSDFCAPLRRSVANSTSGSRSNQVGSHGDVISLIRAAAKQQQNQASGVSVTPSTSGEITVKTEDLMVTQCDGSVQINGEYKVTTRSPSNQMTVEGSGSTTVTNSGYQTDRDLSVRLISNDIDEERLATLSNLFGPR